MERVAGRLGLSKNQARGFCRSLVLRAERIAGGL